MINVIVHCSDELIIKFRAGEDIDPVAGLNEEDDHSKYFLANRVPCDPNVINRRRVAHSCLSSSSSESVDAHSDFEHAKVLKSAITSPRRTIIASN